MNVALRKVGNSQAVIIPKAVLQQLGLSDSLEMVVVDNKIILSKPSNVRAGWGEAAMHLAAISDDELLDFPQDSEEEWVW